MHELVERIRQYPWATYLLIAVNVFVFAIMEFSGYSSSNGYDLLDWGANFHPYTFKNEWWRLITSMFLHIGFIHLFVNMYSLFNLGTYVESAFGHRAFIVTYFLTGIAGSLASGYYNLYVIGAGASGAIFGIYGFHIVQVLAHSWDDKRAVRNALLNFVLYLIVMTWIGTMANFDNAAHYGGLISGVLIAIIDLAFNKNRSHRIYPLVLVVGIVFIIIGYFTIPSFKVQYFDMFQHFMKADNNTSTKLSSQYPTDEEMANDLELSLAEWDSINTELDSLPALPEELSHDKELISYYIQLRKSELDYLITGIRQESYIYMDSLDIVRSEMRVNPPLNYVLNYKRPEESPEQKDSTNQTEPFREIATVFYDSNWRECPRWEHVYYRRGYKDSLGRWNGFVQDFYKSGKIQMKGKYTRDLRDGIFLYYDENDTYSAAGMYKNDLKVGKWQYFYDTKQMQSEVRYADWAYTINSWDSLGNQMVNEGNGEDIHLYSNGVVASYQKYDEGRLSGEAYGNHEDGSPYFKEYYENGELLYGVSYPKSGGRNEYDVSTFIPHPQGGGKAFMEYLKNKKIYPKEARSNNIKGELDAIFTIYEDGNIGDIRFLNELGYGCEEEVKRLLKEGPKWIPAYIHGYEPVTSETRVRVAFP